MASDVSQRIVYGIGVLGVSLVATKPAIAVTPDPTQDFVASEENVKDESAETLEQPALTIDPKSKTDSTSINALLNSQSSQLLSTIPGVAEIAETEEQTIKKTAVSALLPAQLNQRPPVEDLFANVGNRAEQSELSQTTPVEETDSRDLLRFQSNLPPNSEPETVTASEPSETADPSQTKLVSETEQTIKKPAVSALLAAQPNQQPPVEDLFNNVEHPAEQQALSQPTPVQEIEETDSRDLLHFQSNLPPNSKSESVKVSELSESSAPSQTRPASETGQTIKKTAVSALLPAQPNQQPPVEDLFANVEHPTEQPALSQPNPVREVEETDNIDLLRFQSNLPPNSEPESVTAPEQSESSASSQSLLIAEGGTAAEITSVSDLLRFNNSSDALQGQVTSVSQLSDVQPGDWAFQALQSLVERYGCIAGYPNGTFRGNRSTTRYELAAALNACLDQISDRFASKADFDTVKALQDEFAAELATLRGRVDGLESRVDTVEAQQFSTTTKLNATAIFGAGFVIDEENALDSVLGVDTDEGNIGEDRVFLAPRVRLNFDTSFSGTDRLRIRLQTANVPELDNEGAAGTSLARLSFDDADNNEALLDEINYRFKPFDRLTLKASLQGGDYRDDVETFNPFLASSDTGALSRFFRFNPTVHRAPGDTVFSAIYEANDTFEFSVSAAAGDADLAVADADNNGGLFGGGQFGVFAQVGVTLSERLRFGVQYARSEFRGSPDITSDTGDAPTTGGGLGPGGDTSDPFDGLDTTTDNFGFSVDSKIADFLHFSGWAGLTLARSPELVDSEVKLINWAAQFILPDLFAEGNKASISVGQQPYIFDRGNLNGTGVTDGSNPNFIAELQYQFQVNDNINVTPGVIMVVNPNNTSSNDPIFIPIIRTTFSF